MTERRCRAISTATDDSPPDHTAEGHGRVMTLPTRTLGTEVSAQGLGCMSMTHEADRHVASSGPRRDLPRHGRGHGLTENEKLAARTIADLVPAVGDGAPDQLLGSARP